MPSIEQSNGIGTLKSVGLAIGMTVGIAVAEVATTRLYVFGKTAAE